VPNPGQTYRKGRSKRTVTEVTQHRVWYRERGVLAGVTKSQWSAWARTAEVIES